MAITIDGDGTITGLSVGGLPDGVVDADMLAANAVTTAKISDSQITEAKLASDPQQGVAKAWGRVASNATISDSFNVSSVTDDGTGKYAVALTSAMPSANYSVTGAVATNAASMLAVDDIATGGFDICLSRFDGNMSDNPFSFAVFGD